MDIASNSAFSSEVPFAFRPPQCLPVRVTITEHRIDEPPSGRDSREPTPADDRDSLPPGDDSCWDVFLPDDDELDPLPEPGDFWFDPS